MSRIEKSYPQWVRGTVGALEAIQKAERMAATLNTTEGASLYAKYLAECGGYGSVAKSQPTPGDVHINVPLTNIAIAFLPEQKFVADQVFPNVPVEKQSNLYYEFPKGQWFRTDAQERAPGTASAGSGYSMTSSQYSCRVKALHKTIPDQVRANEDPVINQDRLATLFVMRQLAILRERDWASNFFSTGIWTGSTGGDITPSTLWDDPNSTPIENLEEQLTSVEEKTGYRPNTAVLGKKVWTSLKNHPQFLERIKYSEKGIIGLDLLAEVLELERVLVASAVQNTAAEGATPVMGRVLSSTSALVCYAAPQPGLMVPSAGYTFSWTGHTGAGPSGQRIKRFRDEPKSSDIIEGEMAYDMKVVASDLGAFFTGAVS